MPTIPSSKVCTHSQGVRMKYIVEFGTPRLIFSCRFLWLRLRVWACAHGLCVNVCKGETLCAEGAECLIGICFDL